MQQNEKDKSGSERRRDPRNEVFHGATVSFGTDNQEVIVSNISRRGALLFLELEDGTALEAKAPLKEGGVLTLTIPALSVADEPGRIVRVQPGLRGLSIGAEFVRPIEIPL